jgi:nicotinamidase-related amidase
MKTSRPAAFAVWSSVLTPSLWALCLIAQSSQATQPAAWWTFDDPAALGRDSAGNNDAALVGAPLACSGVRNNGILMNGAGDFLRVPDSPSLEITGPLTVLVWANANAVNKNYALVYKATSWDDGQMAYMLDLDWSSGGYYPRFAVSSDGHASGYVTVISPEALTTGQWHLIAGVYDGTNLIVYVDGQLKSSVACTAGIYPGTDPLYIGWNWSATWKGALDEVRIFDVALTQAEMLGEFQNQEPALNASLPGFFGRVGVGQARTNQVIVSDDGPGELNVAPLQVTGPDAAYFQVLTPSSGFMLQPGLTNAVTAQVRFAPDALRTYSALLTINSSANSISIPLAGQGINDKTFSLNLQKRDDSGEIIVTQKTFHGSQLALLVVDTWNSHPDSEMASRVASLVPRMNQALDAARDLGITVIFCPSDCLADFDGTSYRNSIMNLPYQQTGDNGFNPPLPPYTDSIVGNMVPPSKAVPAYPMWTHQHPDLVMKPGDLASLDLQEIFNYCAENGITSLLYTGAAANMCVASWRTFSMVEMKRFCNLEPIMVRDMTDSMTLNGRSPADYSAVDLTMTPDRGHREVTAHNEQYICSTIDAAQLMQQWTPSAYTCLVSGQSNLLCYWRLDSKAGYRDCLDIQRTQSCWWYDQTNGLGFGVAGAIVQDPDTAMQFKGSTTLLISPIYRGHIPTNSPLVSLSATNFTLEAWVQAAALNTNQWFFAHDNGLTNGVDVLLGLNSSNHFQFIVGTDALGGGYGDVLQSAATVTQGDVASNRWFHIVAVHDVAQAAVSLYINGDLDSQGVHVCHPVSLDLAPHLGSRGTVTVDEAGKLSNPGFDFLQGALDEVAIYTAPLDSDLVRVHYQTAQGGNLVTAKATPIATLAVNNSPVTYDGTAKTATVVITAGSVPGTVTNILIGGAANQTEAGTYAVTADFVPADLTNFNILLGQPAGNFVIEKATPTVTLAVDNSPVTYDGTAKTATVGITVSSVPGTVTNILTDGAASQTGAGSYTVTADFVPDDSANYNSLLGQAAGDIVIQKATPTATLAVNNSPVTYDGTAKAAAVIISVSSVPGSVANTLTGGAASQTGAGTYAVTADFVPDDSANYNSLMGLAAGNFVIQKATPTATLAVNNSPVTYDGTAQAATVGITASSVPGSLANILTGGAASQTGAGTYAVTADFVPTDSANYNSLLGQSAGNFVIQKAALMITSGITADDKVSDGGTSGTISSNNVVLAGIVDADKGQVDLSTNGYTATFDNAGPGENIGVTVDGLSLTGAKAGDYALTQPTGLTAKIGKAAVTITSGITADGKVYDGTTSATISSNNVVLSGIEDTDVGQVDLSTNGYVATFTSPNAGPDIGVTVSGLSLIGTKAGEYVLTQPTGLTAAIAKATPTATVAVNNSPVTYDGTAQAATVGITASSVPGSVANTLTGGAASQTGAGTFAVTADFVPDDSANYNSLLEQAAGSFVIAQANSATALASSENPSLQGSNVTFTATVTPITQATSTPTGSVQFYTNGVNCGSPMPLSGGVAIITVAFFEIGENNVDATYLPDSNFLGSVDNLVQLVNSTPQPPITVSIQNNGNGSVAVSFSGTPGANYIVQAKSDLGSATAWENVSTNTAGTDGNWTFSESTGNHPVRFYRSAIP